MVAASEGWWCRKSIATFPGIFTLPWLLRRTQGARGLTGCTSFDDDGSRGKTLPRQIFGFGPVRRARKDYVIGLLGSSSTQADVH